MVNPMTSINPNAKLAEGVVVDAFVTITADVEIGKGTWIGPNVTIMDGARIGENCKIFPGTVISAIPQDLKFNGEETLTYIGDNTIIRECVTVNKGTSALGYTKIGSNSLIMATVHIAHDCVIGDNVIIVNGTSLAGHVEIDDWAIIGGMSAVHQFNRIGRHSLISGGTLVRKDVPPYVKAGRNPVSYVGVNSVGLRRRGFDTEKISELQTVYRLLYQKNLNVTQATYMIESEIAPTAERDEIIQFINDSSRGIMRGYNPNKI